MYRRYHFRPSSLLPSLVRFDLWLKESDKWKPVYPDLATVTLLVKSVIFPLILLSI
jgi:hypothetical protein